MGKFSHRLPILQSSQGRAYPGRSRHAPAAEAKSSTRFGGIYF